MQVGKEQARKYLQKPSRKCSQISEVFQKIYVSTFDQVYVRIVMKLDRKLQVFFLQTLYNLPQIRENFFWM